MPLVLKRPLAKVGGLKKPGTIAKPATGSGKISATGSFAKAQTERKRIENERNRPFEVTVPVGGSLEVYILDKGEPFGRYEHNVGGGPGKRGEVFPCLQDTGAACPICAKEGKQGTYTQYLTAVVPVEKWINKQNEQVTRRFQKKLFAIKNKMSSKYARIYEQYGSFRGLVLKLHRDDKMEPKTGSDVTVVRKMSEAEIAKFATANGIKGLDKESADNIRKAKIDQPFDYQKAFPQIDAKTLAQMVGASAADGGGVGSADFDTGDEGGVEDNWGVE